MAAMKLRLLSSLRDVKFEGRESGNCWLADHAGPENNAYRIFIRPREPVRSDGKSSSSNHPGTGATRRDPPSQQAT